MRDLPSRYQFTAPTLSFNLCIYQQYALLDEYYAILTPFSSAGTFFRCSKPNQHLGNGPL